LEESQKNNYNYILENTFFLVRRWIEVAYQDVVNWDINNLFNGFRWLDENILTANITIWIPIIMLVAFVSYIKFMNFFVRS